MLCESVNTSKFEAPIVGGLTIKRLGIHEVFENVEGIVSLCAPAGFGKTLAVAGWVESINMPTVWLSLDDGDDHYSRFWGDVLTAFERSNILSAKIAEQYRQALTIEKKNWLDDFTQFLLEKDIAPSVFVVDRCDVIGSVNVERSFASFVNALKEKSVIVLIGRSNSVINRLSSSTEEDEMFMRIGPDHLAFNFEEARQITSNIERGYKERGEELTVDGKFVASFWCDTEGWPYFYSRYLLAVYNTHEENVPILKKAGVKRFISDEIFLNITDDQKVVIKELSVFPQIDEFICNSFASHMNGEKLLQELANESQMLIADSNGQYRFRNIFREFLIDLDEDAIHRNNIIENNIDLSVLSKREMQVLELMSTGISNGAIAEKLCRSLGTVKVHVHNIYQKLEVDNRVMAIGKYNEHRMMSLT